MSAPNDKSRLSAEQKKANHIESERKRREAIRSGFESLSDIVPETAGQARSEGVVLANTIRYINQLTEKKEVMRQKALATGMPPLEFEQHYREAAKKKREEAEAQEASSSAQPSSSKTGGR